MDPECPMLLILDLDETLIHATETPLRRSHDLVVGPYLIHLRPRLGEFLIACSACFHLAIWSSASDEYVRQVVERIIPEGIEPVFAWGRSRCVRRYDPERREDEFLKDLKKVKRAGYRLERVLIVDDSPRKLQRQYGNAVYVPPFFGDLDDETLPRLARFLVTLRDVADVRTVEKRGWSFEVR